MSFSDPRTWVTGELVTASLLNVQLRDQLDAIVEGTTGAYVNAVVGPHAIGGSTVDYVRLGLTGAFTSGGASTIAFGLYTSGVLTGHSGDSAAIAGIKANNSIVTTGNCTTIAQLWVSEPQITVGSGTVTNSATVYIESAATEATNDYALWVDAGASRFDGTITATQYLSGTSAAIAPDATTNLYASSGASGPDGGMIAVRDGYSRFGLFWYGSYDTLTKLAGNSVYSASKDNATTINIYYESGNIVYQNKTAIDPFSVSYTRLLY
jgi:hypothetical protein